MNKARSKAYRTAYAAVLRDFPPGGGLLAATARTLAAQHAGEIADARKAYKRSCAHSLSNATAILRTHGCGASFTLAEWFALPYVGVVEDDVVILEQRNCPCGSTLTLPIAYANTPEGREEAASHKP